MGKVTREKFKTYGNVFDNFTIETIKKLISQGHLDGIEGPLSIGKESNIFKAKKGDSYLIAKIYRLEACDFNRMYDYLKFDVRYTKIKKGKRNIVFTWTQREYRNLMGARDAGVNVPTPITRLNNVLLLELIGNRDTGEAAPQVKRLLPADAGDFLQKLTLEMKKLHKAGLVHGDLSEFNILNSNETPCIIDMSQSTSLKSQNSMELLARDCRNISRFFEKLGLSISQEQLLSNILK